MTLKIIRLVRRIKVTNWLGEISFGRVRKCIFFTKCDINFEMSFFVRLRLDIVS